MAFANRALLSVLTLVLVVVPSCLGFSNPLPIRAGSAPLARSAVLPTGRSAVVGMSMQAEQEEKIVSRRKILYRSAAAASVSVISGAAPAYAAFEERTTDWYKPTTVPGEMPTFKGDEWQGPTWSKPTDEESISFQAFLKNLREGNVIVVDFIGPNGEKVYAWLKSTNARIRIGEGLPDETTPPPPNPLCAACLEGCPPDDKTCSCLSSCGGKNTWNSPLYTARVVRKGGVPFRYSRKDDSSFANPINLWFKWVMFDGPLSAGVI